MGLRSKLLSLILGSCFLINGCKLTIPSPKPKNWDIYPGVGLRAGGDIVFYRASIPESLQTDSFGTATELENDLNPGIRPYLGLEGFLGWKSTRLRIALDGQYNYKTSGYRDGIFDVEREPGTGESYAFSQLGLREFTFMPSAGLEQTFFDKSILGFEVDKLILGFEVGLPYNEFTFKSGRDTYGRWETEKKDSDSVFGVRYAGKILYGIDFKKRKEYMNLGIEFGYERYNPKFLGERSKIEGFAPALVFELGF